MSEYGERLQAGFCLIRGPYGPEVDVEEDLWAREVELGDLIKFEEDDDDSPDGRILHKW